METWQLYCATSPSGKRYFGITSVDLPLREKRHRDTGAKYQTIFHKALKKYGKAMVFETWAVGERAYIHDLEVRAIEKFQTTDRRFGYNQCLGGNLSPMLVPEIAVLAGSKKKGRKQTPEHIEKATAHLRTPEARAASGKRLKENRAEREAARLEGIRRSSANPEVKAARQKRGSERFKTLNADPEFVAKSRERIIAMNKARAAQRAALEDHEKQNTPKSQKPAKPRKELAAATVKPKADQDSRANRRRAYIKAWEAHISDPENIPEPVWQIKKRNLRVYVKQDVNSLDGAC